MLKTVDDLKTDSVAAKLRRAEYLVGQLNSTIDDVSRQLREEISVRSGFFENETVYELQAKFDGTVGLQVSVIFGEVMHHLRSCLDYLVWEAAKINGTTPRRDHQFPICDDVDSFQKQKKRKLRGVSAAFVRKVEELQPYHLVPHTKSRLRAISTLNNIDKHRLLLVVGATAAMREECKVGSSSKDVVLTGFSPPQTVQLSSEWRTFFSINLESPVPDFWAEMPYKLSLCLNDVAEVAEVPIDQLAAGLFERVAFSAFELEDAM